MSRKRPIPNSLRQKFSHAKTMANLVNRLPIQDRLNSTKSVLLQLDPIWQAWIENQFRDSQGLRQHSKVKSVENSTLIIHCSSASYATLLRHQSASLLDTLKQEGFTSVNRIAIKVEHPTQKNLSAKKLSQEKKGKPSSHSTQVNSGLVSQPLVNRAKVKSADLKAIQSAAQSIENQSLSAALSRLAATLKSRS